ncbi:Cyclohexanone 1,2-monooxygenase [Cyphellophora attinorum]|uniref:Cyclohexanone 1,2-monooxygenase n=1 Tax=Cyphellophora attinorum TaxID=1664694 RepID=A0A0N1H959_9EURO|nr:Cyclohexanone 1,2-monooxygenase [Phialophora attinorum]KPI43922.1 Cyclohexanone 1,2-monooxygenase [Phialophora attinorum]
MLAREIEPRRLTHDALIVGAGFGGLYQLYKLRQLGMDVKVIDTASDVGGTWYWNRYPGAMSDTESYLYRYSWDDDDLFTSPNRYVMGPEIFTYLRGVADRHDLRRHIELETSLVSAVYDEHLNSWTVTTSRDQIITVRYLITALGLLSKINYPDIPGIPDFQGEKYHTAAWPENLDLTNKRVGIIGNGSTGVQVITALAKEGKVQRLISFQRHPQYSVPAGNRALTERERVDINASYQDIWPSVKDSATAFGITESLTPMAAIAPEKRKAVLQKAWDEGNAFRYMFSTFADITYNEDANEAAADFIREKIRETVKDPEKARKLCPSEPYARRPLCDSGYYEQFNKDFVDIVSLKENPIAKFNERGLALQDGSEIELDVIIFATGFDAVDGSYKNVTIKGRSGIDLKDHWRETGPASFMGIAVAQYPNLFMILGPNGPFANNPPAIETQAELITDCIAYAEHFATTQDKHAVAAPAIEVAEEAEQNWTDLCDQASANSLFRKIDSSWIFGQNIKGKRFSSLFYFPGLGEYRRRIQEMKANGWAGFLLSVGHAA